MAKLNLLFSLILNVLFSIVLGFDPKGFDDSVMYHINWVGQMPFEPFRINSPEIKTVFGNPLEVYECAMPVATKESTTENDYTGPSPFELVASLFSSSVCSYRIESYWTYEICHGHYIKQYHEEREGKVSKLQEYYLGKWNKQKTESLLEKDKAPGNRSNDTALKYKKVLSMNLPYVEVEMSDGTVCDLNNQPRVTRVLYVCYTNGKNEVFSLKETMSCNYEVIILTSVLCNHPKYKPEETTINVINCGAVYTVTPRKPRALMAMELESLKMQYQKLPDFESDNLKDIAVVNFKDGTLKMEILQADQIRSLLNDELDETPPPIITKPLSLPIKISHTIDDTSPVTAFLQGKNCLTGGTGWWKYEFCYGRHVRQFHTDQNGETSVYLGYFDEERHREWIRKNEAKRPNQTGAKPQLTHFYLDGAMCEKTGQYRQTEVKLKCMEKATSPAAVSLYLMEPKTCQYILGVESPLICDIIPKADEDGLVSMPSLTEKHSRQKPTTPTKQNEKEEGILLGTAVVEDFEVRFEND